MGHGPSGNLSGSRLGPDGCLYLLPSVRIPIWRCCSHPTLHGWCIWHVTLELCSNIDCRVARHILQEEHKHVM